MVIPRRGTELGDRHQIAKQSSIIASRAESAPTHHHHCSVATHRLSRHSTGPGCSGWACRLPTTRAGVHKRGSSRTGPPGPEGTTCPPRCAQSLGRRSRPRIQHRIHAAAQAGRSPLVRGQLIWSTGTYLFCGPCSYGDQALAHVAARQSAGDCCRADLLLFRDRGELPRRETGQECKSAGQRPCVEPPWRDRTAYPLLTMDNQHVPVTAAEALNCPDAGSR